MSGEAYSTVYDGTASFAAFLYHGRAQDKTGKVRSHGHPLKQNRSGRVPLIKHTRNLGLPSKTTAKRYQPDLVEHMNEGKLHIVEPTSKYRLSLFKDFAYALRRGMAMQGYDITSVRDDDRAAVMLQLKKERYEIQVRPRKIEKPVGFRCPSGRSDGLYGLEKAISAGVDLRPYRSRRIENAQFLDGLLDYWNIHHFHLGRIIEAEGFVERTNELLFCLVEDDCVYFIAIMCHDSSPWAKKELITIIHENWPGVLEKCRVRGVDKLEWELRDEDHKELREARVATVLDMPDGTIYMEPSLGLTSGGEHVLDLMDANRIKRAADSVESEIEANWSEISDNAQKQGFHFKGEVALSLLRTIPLEYWDVIESESGYWFRINL